MDTPLVLPCSLLATFTHIYLTGERMGQKMGGLCLWAWLAGGSRDSEGKGSRKKWSPTWVLGVAAAW